MNPAIEIQKFLKKKLTKYKLSRKDFSVKIAIPYPTITRLINSIRDNPELSTVIKLANYFSCTVDEVVGRKHYISPSTKKCHFSNLSDEEISTTLKVFIKNKLFELNLNPYTFSKDLGFSENSIRHFIKDNSIQKKLRCKIVIALADYFDVSIDEMIGRVSPSNNESE